MAISNRERVGKALELLNAGLQPYVEREMKAAFDKRWIAEMLSVVDSINMLSPSVPGTVPKLDTTALIGILNEYWKPVTKKAVFSKTLGKAELNWIHEIRQIRNDWAHQRAFTIDDTYRVLDTIERLLTAISATEADEVGKQKQELLRLRFEEQARQQTRRSITAPLEGQPASNLKPWRDIITPHPDVASGKFQQAEFAADLWQVYQGEGSDEYRKPKEFFRRTFLTEGLKQLLTGALKRLNGTGGDPVIELQTNFGGGKTHSMLALFHLFSGVPATELPGMEPLLKSAEADTPKKVTRVVLVGNKISPGQPLDKPDGTIVRTLWGELAWQLGGREAFDVIRKSDETSTNPGDLLRVLFNKYSPCLILIDEWVAYARQLHTENDLPAGSFETHFTFAQTLSEAAKAANKTLLVVSIPASEDRKTHSQDKVSDIEVGGDRGREALDRLKNAIGRVESPWRPASTEEGFEIVRRRLFQPITDPALYVSRDAVVRNFMEFYRKESQEFPSDCSKSDYENRLKTAYPIHPELFDRLYEDWSSLDRFQRTRGVLRLMAAVIHTLWKGEDKNLLIMPATIPIDEVQSELTRYLDDNWQTVIETDVDGQKSLPLKLDLEYPNLGRFSACRRVARTLYLGSAPTIRASNQGLEEKQIKLGCVQPGEVVATFGDALRRLTDQATYLYVNGKRFWYSTLPSVTKMADEIANNLTLDDVIDEVGKRIIEAAKQPGDFARVHFKFPTKIDGVSDEPKAGLVILDPKNLHTAKDLTSPAMKLATTILDNCEKYKNMLVFLAADKRRFSELEDAVRKYLAWQSISEKYKKEQEQETENRELNLDAHQLNQVKSKLADAKMMVESRIPETYCWLLVPTQPDSTGKIEWEESRLQTTDPIVIRASKKLRNDASLITKYGAISLRTELDRIPLWQGNHVNIKVLAEYFAKYIYLPRLKSTGVLLEAIKEGVEMLSWQTETFAYAERWDETKQRYLGLKAGDVCSVLLTDESVLVKPEAAESQLQADIAKQQQLTTASLSPTFVATSDSNTSNASITGSSPNIYAPVLVTSTSTTKQPTRFFGSVELDATRLGRDAGKIAEEVVQHLVGLIGSKVKITLEVQADVSDGIPENIVRTVIENCRTLKFKDQGFESD